MITALERQAITGMLLAAAASDRNCCPIMNFISFLFQIRLSLRILKNFFCGLPPMKKFDLTRCTVCGTKTPLRAFKRNYAHKLHRYAAKSRRAAR